MTYHLSHKCSDKTIMDNTYLFNMNEYLKYVFFPGDMDSAGILSSYVLRTKLHPVNLKGGFKDCCEVYDYVTYIDTSTTIVNVEFFKVNHQLNCNGRLIIYLLQIKIYW